MNNSLIKFFFITVTTVAFYAYFINSKLPQGYRAPVALLLGAAIAYATKEKQPN